MRALLAVLGWLVALVVVGCTPIEPRPQQSNVQMETGHVDSGGGGGGSM
jgi:hypothetical protein